METIGLWINRLNPQCAPVARRVHQRMAQAGVACVQINPPQEPDSYDYIPRLEAPLSLDNCPVVAVLGGDGTLLSAARVVAPLGIPMVGINLGHRGFMTTAEAAETDHAVDALLGGSFRVEERMMLQAQIGAGASVYTALNEFGVFHSQRSRMLELCVDVNGERVDEYYADGVLISTPTGSTAYSLSAGGPLVVPEMECIVIVPVCASSLHTRPIVLPPDARVQLRTASRRPEGAQLTADGQVDAPVAPREVVTVQRAPWRARLLRIDNRGFFQVLRQKMLEWGAAPEHDGGRR